MGGGGVGTGAASFIFPLNHLLSQPTRLAGHEQERKRTIERKRASGREAVTVVSMATLRALAMRRWPCLRDRSASPRGVGATVDFIYSSQAPATSPGSSVYHNRLHCSQTGRGKGEKGDESVCGKDEDRVGQIQTGWASLHASNHCGI